MNYQTLLRSPIVSPQAIPLIEKASRNNAPVLITGEKGTGKELVARIIHHTGESQPHAFYRVDCKFMKEAVFEDQLSRVSKSLPNHSTVGTVFLKEVGSLGQEAQSHLLEVMERSLFQLGAGTDHASSLRFISSSSEDLRAKVAQGQFIEDLYDRVNTLSIFIPSLRERAEEISALAAYLLREHSGKMKIKKAGLSRHALKLLESYWWPGNLREFERVILRSAVLSETETLTVQDLLSGLEHEKNPFVSFIRRTKLGQTPAKRNDSPEAPSALPLPLFCIELVHRIKNPLVSIKTFTQLLREKFNDPEYRNYFYRIVTEDIEKIDSVLNGLLGYIKINTPTSKSDTIHLVLEEILTKRSGQIDERRIKVFKKFEKDLPETIVHDEQLRYVLDTLFSYALSSALPGGSIGFLTKSFDRPYGPEEEIASRREERWVEILIVFTGYRTSAERFEAVLGLSPVASDESIDLELRLVREIIQKNRGTMKVEVNEAKTRTLISLRLPVERRRLLSYPGADLEES